MLNWTEDGQLDDKQNQKDSKIPYRAYLQKNVRIFRLLFVLAFMLTDAGLTLRNVTIFCFTFIIIAIINIKIFRLLNVRKQARRTGIIAKTFPVLAMHLEPL